MSSQKSSRPGRRRLNNIMARMGGCPKGGDELDTIPELWSAYPPGKTSTTRLS